LAVITALTPELMLVIFLLFMLVGLHYFVWGWWLGNVIRREAEPERQGEES
jgi:hypothetical protein